MIINSWRDIPDDFLIVQGLTHPYYFTTERLSNFFKDIAKIADMKPLGEPMMVSVPCDDTCRQVGGLNEHDFCALQFWHTSGVTVYTWDIGKITVVVHSCKDIDYEKVKEFIIGFWHLGDHESFEVRLPKEREWKSL